MKNTNIDKMITMKQKELIVVVKEKIINDKKEVRLDLKARWISPPITDYISIQPFTLDTHHNLTSLEKNEMIALAKNDCKEFISELINLNFKNDLINSEQIGANIILPARFQRFYDKCVCFASENYTIYFVDDAIEYFSNKIAELKLRRIEDSYTYAAKTIDSGIVKNLKLNVFDGFNFRKHNYCWYDANDDYYRMQTEPSNVLYYQTTLENGKTNTKDIENMVNIIDKYVLCNGPIKYISAFSTELFAKRNVYSQDYIKINGIDEAPELVKKINSLYKR